MNSIVGQKLIVNALRRAVENGTALSAYIFTGEPGMGKKHMAGAFAKALLCEAPKGGSACGVCRSCRLFNERRNPDVFYVAGTKTKSIGVDDIREQIKRPAQSKPFEFARKIFIVDEAETMTAQAQNALLKIIEEPPAYAVFLFLAANLHTMLPTVLSRCVTYKLKPLTDAEVKKVLDARGVKLEDTSFAQGNAGRAIEMASSEKFKAMANLAKETARSIGGADALTALGWYKRFEEYKDDARMMLDMLYVAFAGKVQCVDAVVSAKKALERNANFQLTMELLLLKLSGGNYDRSWCAL